MRQISYENYFNYQDGILFSDGINLQEFCEKNHTPSYFYSNNAIVDAITLIRGKNNIQNLEICYAVKALSNVNILKIFAENKIGADCVSGGEIARCLKAKIPASQIVFSGTAKTDFDINFAISNDILQINAESFFEVEKINEIAQKMGKICNVAIRIRPNTTISTHKFISTGNEESKFGISVNDITSHEISKILSMKNVNLVGFSVHIGSQISKIAEYQAAYEVLADIIRKFPEVNLQRIDLGGGFAAVYKADDLSFDFAKYFQMVSSIFKEQIEKNVKFIIEPGRFMVANCGILLTKVLCIKENDGRKFAILDSGMNDLMRVALYDAHHDILPIKPRENKDFYNICGRICESSDFFAKNREISRIQAGDFLAIMSSGAYGSSMSSRYNSHGFIPEYLSFSGKTFQIRRGESIDDILKNEIMSDLF